MEANRFNTILTGFITGIIIPAVFLIVILLARKNQYALGEFIQIVYDMAILPKLISICLIPNLLLFFIFIWKNYLRSARGVLLSMFLAGLVIGLMKVL